MINQPHHFHHHRSGQLVLFKTHLEIYESPGGLHKILDVPIKGIERADCPPPAFGIFGWPSVVLFLKAEDYERTVSQLRENAGIFGFLVPENSEHKLVWPCGSEKREAVEGFVTKINGLRKK